MIQLLIFNNPVYYRTKVMTLDESLKFIEENHYPNFFYLFDCPENQFLEESKILYDDQKIKEMDSEYFFKKEDLDDNEWYIDYDRDNIDIPFGEFFEDFNNKVWYLGFDCKIPYLETLEECQKCDVVEMSIIELKQFLTDKIPLNESVEDFEFDENVFPCIVYYKNKINPEITNFMVLNRFSYLKNKLLTDPDSLVKVKKLFLEV